MFSDPIQDVARLLTTVIQTHGAEELVSYLPPDVVKSLHQNFHKNNRRAAPDVARVSPDDVAKS